MADVELLQRRLDRERAARKAAESLLEQKSLEVYEANQKLQDLADRTNAIVETAAEGIITYDCDGIVRSFNRSAKRIFGVASGVDQNIRMFFKDNPRRDSVLFPCWAYDDGENIDQHSPSESAELIGVRGHEKFFAEVAISRTTHRAQTTFTALVRDLSRRKQLEARLGQAQKMESVGQLAAGIAHEINTPIQFVGDNIRFLQSAFNDIAELLDAFEELATTVAAGGPADCLLKRIQNQSEIVDLPFLREEFPGAIQQSIQGIERVATIVRAMKDFSQPASESKSSVDINLAIQNTLDVSRNLYRDIAVVETFLDTELKPIPGLAGQLNQCLLNILTNAFEAIRDHHDLKTGQISITTRKLDDCVEIVIEDNGPGIPTDIRDRIFDPFFTTKEVGKGTGQGLAFVYDVIVNKHDGAIHVQSTAGQSTTFIISLPTVNSPEPREQSHAHAAH